MTTVSDSFVILCGCLLAGAALLYGCVHVRPGSLVRWLVFGMVAVIGTQFGWLPLLPYLGFSPASTSDQYVAVLILTVLLKVTMEVILPYTLWAEEVDDEEE